MQVSGQIDEPDFGTLFDEMLYESGQPIPAARFIRPRVEVELAFLLRKPLGGPNISIANVLNATDRVTPALEIIDARVEQFDRETGAPRKVFDTISDNAANAGIVLGGSPVPPDQVDLRWVSALLHITASSRTPGSLPRSSATRQRHRVAGPPPAPIRRAPRGRRDRPRRIVHPCRALSTGDVVQADYGRLGTVSFQLI